MLCKRDNQLEHRRPGRDCFNLVSQTVYEMNTSTLDFIVNTRRNSPKRLSTRLVIDHLSSMKFNVQHSTMSPVLPFDIIALIIGEDENTNLLRSLARVSPSFYQISSKYLFATVELYDATHCDHIRSSKKAFVKLLEGRPDAVKYIRKLTYIVDYRINDGDHLLSPILLNFVPTFSRLNCLTINGSHRDWNTLDSSLTSVFLHLMHLTTINHIELSYIVNFPLSSLTSSVNLHRLHLGHVSRPYIKDGSFEIVQSETAPKIREFHILRSSAMLQQDGRPAFNFMDLRRLSIALGWCEDEQNIRYLLQNAKLLEKLHLSVGHDLRLVGLLSLGAHTIKVLDLTVLIYDSVPLLEGLCEGLEAMAGHNMLEALSFEIRLPGDFYMDPDFMGSTFQTVENVLFKPGWSALRQVFF